MGRSMRGAPWCAPGWDALRGKRGGKGWEDARRARARSGESKGETPPPHNHKAIVLLWRKTQGKAAISQFVCCPLGASPPLARVTHTSTPPCNSRC